MGNINKKYNIVEDLLQADNTVKTMVLKGALRNYIKRFYDVDVNKIIKEFGVDRRETGHRFVNGLVFNEFVGEKASLFESKKLTKYTYLNINTLIYYSAYLKGLSFDLTQYAQTNPNADVNCLEKRIKEFAKYFKTANKIYDCTPNDKMANVTLYKESLDMYNHYLQQDAKSVKNVLDIYIEYFEQCFDKNNVLSNMFYFSSNDLMPIFSKVNLNENNEQIEQQQKQEEFVTYDAPKAYEEYEANEYNDYDIPDEVDEYIRNLK